MAYEKQTWSTGDTVTAAKLNHIEDGIAAKNKFIVTLTPTALDYSGTMDKTVAEINAAYEAGQEIWFKVMSATSYSMCPITQVGKGVPDYPSYNAYIIDIVNNALVLAYTGTTDDGTKQTYYTKVYALTPAS